MKMCPKCKEPEPYLRVYGTFSGSQKIQFRRNDDFEVVDDDINDFEWDDYMECIDCGFDGPESEFEVPDEHGVEA